VTQNPSIVLALLALMLRWFYRYILVVDSHNAGIHPFEGRSIFVNFISKFIQKSADCTIVTNDNLKRIVELNGGSAFVLPDKIPVPPATVHVDLGKRSICFICTYSHDEPYAEVVDAAKFIPPDINILITGKYESKLDPSDVADNVKLLGYLSDEDFWETLRSSDIVMDLTTRDDCLVCGAYEGIALKKPLILSNTEATRKYFYKGCVYVDPNPVAIAAGIICAIKNIPSLEDEVADLKEELDRQWYTSLCNLRMKIKVK
jgi:glycosyltransferase involved in cell wall biosynthesis